MACKAASESADLYLGEAQWTVMNMFSLCYYHYYDYARCSYQIALEGQDLPRTYLACHELESVIAYYYIIMTRHSGIGVWLCTGIVVVLLRLRMLSAKVTALHTK